LGGVVTDDAAAEDDDVRGQDTGDAAEENAAALERPLEKLGAFLDAHAAGDFAHGREQGQGAVAIADGLVGDGGDAGGEDSVCELAVGGEMEIGEDDLAAAHEGPFGGERLLHLDDEIAAGPDFLGRLDEDGALLLVLLVGDAAALSGAGLEEDLVSGAG